MFDSFAIVKIIELQNEADRERWKKDEAAFYRELGDTRFERLSLVWRFIVRLPDTLAGLHKKDRRNLRRSVSNACGGACDQAAR
jgi:hypothetical protein